jgi:hypothetical protein
MNSPTINRLDAGTHAIAAEIVRLDALAKETRENADALRQALMERMAEEGARALPDDTYEIKIESGTPTPDDTVLRPLLELLPEEDVAKVFTEGHYEQVWVGPKWNGTQLNRIRNYGGDIQRIVDAGRIPGPDRLTVRPKVGK